MNGARVRNTLLVFLSWVFAWSAMSQTVELKTDSLSLEVAVKTALENHPYLRAASANVRLAGAGLTQARSTYYPSLTAVATGQHTDGAFVFNPDFPPRNQTYNNYTVGIQAQQ